MMAVVEDQSVVVHGWNVAYLRRKCCGRSECAVAKRRKSAHESFLGLKPSSAEVESGTGPPQCSDCSGVVWRSRGARGERLVVPDAGTRTGAIVKGFSRSLSAGVARDDFRAGDDGGSRARRRSREAGIGGDDDDDREH